MKTGSTENRRTWLTRWLLELCGQDSTSGREDALLPALRTLLEELGAEILEQPVSQGRTNVLALWGEPRVLFSTHLDTVPPFIPPVLEGDILRGRGACEAKGQIAAQLGAEPGGGLAEPEPAQVGAVALGAEGEGVVVSGVGGERGAEREREQHE